MGYDFQCVREIKNARRQRRCFWCGEFLGHHRFRRVGVWEGDFGTDYWHPECHEAMRKTDEDLSESIEPHSHIRGKPDYKDN